MKTRLTALFALLATFALAQDASVKPGINDKFRRFASLDG